MPASYGLMIQFLQQIKKEPQESEYLCNDCNADSHMASRRMAHGCDQDHIGTDLDHQARR